MHYLCDVTIGCVPSQKDLASCNVTFVPKLSSNNKPSRPTVSGMVNVHIPVYMYIRLNFKKDFMLAMIISEEILSLLTYYQHYLVSP